MRITLDKRYPVIVEECAQAVAVVLGRPMSKVGRAFAEGCVIVNAYWKHWPCLFPQHAPGRKHLRAIELVSWQQKIADEHPERLLRGLIQSDGSRDLNFVRGKHYPRYQFSNSSEDIRAIFCRACHLFGVSWTRPSWNTLSISRREEVAKLDLVVGSKTSPAPLGLASSHHR